MKTIFAMVVLAAFAAFGGEPYSVQMLRSEMARMPVPAGIDKRKKPKWEYTDGLLLQGALAVAERHPEVRDEAVAWAQDYIERMVTKDGEILGYRKEDCKLDCINPGKFAFDMYERAVARGDDAEARRLRRVLDTQYSQFAIQPRVAEGGFWHKRVYTRQMWLDGIYMGCPFYARYAAKFLVGEERERAFCDISNQFAVVTRHTYDPATHLYRHGWDEAKEQVWADRATGQSRHAWGRALGWFAAAVVDTIDYIPQEHPARAWLVALANEYFASLIRWQDASGAWWQVADQPGREGNYLESTATALIGYAFVKAWNRGYVGEDVRDAGLKAYEALKRDFIRRDADGTISLTRCCSVAGLSKDRDGSFEYYLREPIRDNDHKGTGPFMLLALQVEELAPRNNAFALGADISWVTAMEAKGAVFRSEDGTPRDCFALMKDYGLTAIRLRVWVDPKDGWCNAADTLAKAMRAKAAGFDVMIDFHYSDTWADPGVQAPPAAWRDHDADGLCRDVAAHTKDVLSLLKANGIEPKWVQIGNETTHGMFWTGKRDENGKTKWVDYGGERGWAVDVDYSMGNIAWQPENYARFFMAGYAAVKDVLPDAAVIVHISKGERWSFTEANLETLRRHGAKWDMVGLSIYPPESRGRSVQGDPEKFMRLGCEAIDATLENIANGAKRWNCPFMIVETGADASPQPPCTVGQSSFLIERLVRGARRIPGGACKGVFYWEPEARPSLYRKGAFAEDGRPTPIMRAMGAR